MKPGKKRERSIVADTSSIILLQKAGILEAFLDSFSVLIPQRVLEEWKAGQGVPSSNGGTLLHRKGEILPSPPSLDSPLLEALDEGEKEVLSIAQSEPFPLVLIDDRKGAKACRKLDLPYICALQIPGLLPGRGRLSTQEEEKQFERLLQLGRYAPWVVEFARTWEHKSLWKGRLDLKEKK